MPVRILSSDADLQMYQAWAMSHPQGNLWQSLEWANYQRAQGKEVRVYATGNEKFDATALIVIDTTVRGYSTWEIPRGPLVSDQWKVESGKYQEFMETIIVEAKKNRCFSLFLAPPLSLSAFDFPLSARHIHPEATRIIDLTQSENDILAQMHSKGRYNISLAQKRGVEIETCAPHVSTENDIEAFYALLQSTGGRDGFRIFQKSHYARFLSDLKGSFMLMAKHENKPIAGLIGVEWNGGAIYYYGASSYEHRHLMAPYLLQWEAIRRAKANGCSTYDLLGISPENAPLDDPWAGISDFKRKFGGTVVTYPPEQVQVLKPVAKQMLEWKRKIFG